MFHRVLVYYTLFLLFITHLFFFFLNPTISYEISAPSILCEYFTPCSCYPCTEYCFHVWGSSTFITLLNRVESKAFRSINSFPPSPACNILFRFASFTTISLQPLLHWTFLFWTVHVWSLRSGEHATLANQHIFSPLLSSFLLQESINLDISLDLPNIFPLQVRTFSSSCCYSSSSYIWRKTSYNSTTKVISALKS